MATVSAHRILPPLGGGNPPYLQVPGSHVLGSLKQSAREQKAFALAPAWS